MSTGQIWLAVITLGVSASILGVQAWVNFIRPAIRQRRMATPYSVCFKLGAEPDAPTASEFVVSANRKVQVDMRLLAHLHYFENETIVGFDGPGNQRPIIKSVSQPFIKDWSMKERSPANDERHYIDYGDNYHIKARTERIRGEHYALGFIVQTKGPGRFPVKFAATTDAGAAKSSNEIVLVVKRKSPKPSKRQSHRRSGKPPLSRTRRSRASAER